MNTFEKYFGLHNFVTFKYQTILIIITTSLMVFFLYQWTFEFFPLEHPNSVHAITPETIQDWGTEPAHVKTGMTITHVLEFDPVANNFTLTAIVWFIFDPKKIPASTIEKFSFVQGIIEEKKSNYQQLPDGTTLAEYYITLRFYQTLNFSRFPFDDHYITLRMTNETVNPHEIVLESTLENLVYMKDIYLPGWWVSNLAVQSGYYQWPLGLQENNIVPKDQPIVQFGIGFPISGMNNILLIIIPLLILFYVQLLSFATKPLHDILELTTLSFAGFIAYSYIVQEISPKIGQFLVSDYFLFFFFISSFSVFLVNMIFLHFHETPYQKLAHSIKGATVIILHASFIGMWYYFLFHYLTADLAIKGIQNVVTVW